RDLEPSLRATADRVQSGEPLQVQLAGLLLGRMAIETELLSQQANFAVVFRGERGERYGLGGRGLCSRQNDQSPQRHRQPQRRPRGARAGAIRPTKIHNVPNRAAVWGVLCLAERQTPGALTREGSFTRRSGEVPTGIRR